MKILYCITLGTWGGAQKHVYELIKDQTKRKNEVILLTGKKGKLTEKVRREFPQVKVVIQDNLKRDLSPRNDLMAIKDLRNYIKNENPDVIHLHSSKAGTLGRLAGIGLNIPVIFTIHGWSFENTDFSTTKRTLFEHLERFLSKFTTKFICVSDYSNQLGKELNIYTNSDQAVVIPNGITNKCVSHTEDNQKWTRLVMVARFSKQKNQELLIKALNKVNANVKLDLLGDGPTLDKCKKLAVDLGVDKNIKFYGAVDDVDSFYEKADVAILISNYEALPLSLIEALRAGLPIIASDVGGNSQLVSYGNGILVENNAKAIAMEIERLARNPQMRKTMGKDSRNLFLREFTKENMLDKTNQVYLSVTEN